MRLTALSSAIIFAAASLDPAGAAGAARGRAAEAERLAAAAEVLPANPGSLASARRAMTLTETFDPTAFVTPGRKGEIVEDAYRAALGEYRRHRAVLYQATGVCLDAHGDARAAVRYLRRALLLDPQGTDVGPLALALAHDGRPEEALEVIRTRVARATLSPRAVAAAGQAADLSGLASLQAEIDRARLEAISLTPRPVPRAGPIRFGEKLRLSTGALLRFDEDAPTVLYVADPGCRSCSEDIEHLRHAVPASVRILVAPAEPDQDRALRQALMLYRVSWPVILGTRAEAYGNVAPVVWVVARGGWSAATITPPVARVLPAVLEVFARHDVSEPRPRPKWNGRPFVPRSPPPLPAAAPGGLPPGEEAPAPAEFDQAEKAFREGRFREALPILSGLEARGDGWLLPPEARLARALCLAHLRETEAARRLLRGIGDSRFQERVDEALESLGP